MADILITLLRRQLGNPTVTDISDNSLTDCVKTALTEYDQWRPKLAMEKIDTVSGQEEYDLNPLTIDVHAVLIAEAATYSDTEAMERLQAMDRTVNHTGYSGVYWRMQDLTLQLVKAPDADGLIIYVLEARARALEAGVVALPKDKITLLLKGAEGQARMRYAGYQGTVRFGSASEDKENQRTEGQRLWDEYVNALKTGYII